MKLYVSHSPASGKITKGTFKARWYKSIKDTNKIGGQIIVNVYGDTKKEVNELAAHLVDLYNNSNGNIVDWLRSNNNRLSFRAIEKELCIPDTTLNKAVSGRQELPKKWVKPLTALKKQMCGGEK